MPLNSDTETLQISWREVEAVFAQAQNSSFYCSIASVGADGRPNVTPIGTVFLSAEWSGYFFDQYTVALAENAVLNPNVCVMAVNSGKLFWLKSLFKGRFESLPGVRLYGTVGPLREASQKERLLVQARVKPTAWLRGSRLLWSHFTHVRDLSFFSCRAVTYPVMMERSGH